MPAPIIAFLRRARRARDGSVAVQIALSLVVLIGLVALGTEISMLYFKQVQLQAMADQAAFSAAVARSQGADPNLEAQAVANQAASDNNDGPVTVTVNIPPTKGSHADPSYGAVEAVLSQTQTLHLVRLVCSTGPCATGLFNVSARAVAMAGASGGYCVLALSPLSSGAITASGGADVNLVNCSIADLSTSPTSISLSGGGTVINAKDVVTAGGYSATGGSTINVTDPPIQTNAANLPADPYSGLAVPTPGACLKTKYTLNKGSATIQPGTYCNGLTVSGGATLTLNPGVYVINGGNFTVSSSTLLGAGVSIVLTGSQVGSVTISGGSTVNITAPAQGMPMAGVAFFQDPRAATGNTNQFSGGTGMVISGAVYFPSGLVNFSGGSGVATKCIELIAWTMKFSGDSSLQLDCTGVAIRPIGGGQVSLVE